jgi:hypothetical protein
LLESGQKVSATLSASGSLMPVFGNRPLGNFRFFPHHLIPSMYALRNASIIFRIILREGSIHTDGGVTQLRFSAPILISSLVAQRPSLLNVVGAEKCGRRRSTIPLFQSTQLWNGPAEVKPQSHLCRR